MRALDDNNVRNCHFLADGRSRGFFLCAPGEGGTGQLVLYLPRVTLIKLIIIQTMDLIFIFLLNTKPDRNLALVASII